MVDVTVDGADEVDPQLNGIKVAVELSSWKRSSQPILKIVFGSMETNLKQSRNSWGFQTSVEVVQYGAENLFHHFEQKGYHPAFRLADDQRFVTDQGNFIIDLDLKVIEDRSSSQ